MKLNYFSVLIRSKIEKNAEIGIKYLEQLKKNQMLKQWKLIII